jgi:hypothetical protein
MSDKALEDLPSRAVSARASVSIISIMQLCMFSFLDAQTPLTAFGSFRLRLVGLARFIDVV